MDSRESRGLSGCFSPSLWKTWVIAGNIGEREGTFSPKIAAIRRFNRFAVSRKTPMSRFGFPMLPRALPGATCQRTLYDSQGLTESPLAIAGWVGDSQTEEANQGLSESVLGAMSILPPAPDGESTSGGHPEQSFRPSTDGDRRGEFGGHAKSLLPISSFVQFGHH